MASIMIIANHNTHLKDGMYANMEVEEGNALRLTTAEGSYFLPVNAEDLTPSNHGTTWTVTHYGKDFTFVTIDSKLIESINKIYHREDDSHSDWETLIK